MPRRSQSQDDREAIFVREYIKDFNGARAAREAGWSARSARTTAATLLAKQDIQDAVAEQVLIRAAAVEFEAQDVVRELIILAASDITNFKVAEGRIEVVDEPWLPPGIEKEWLTRAVRSFKVKTDGTVEIHLWDKPKALNLLGLHLGMLLNEPPPPDPKKHEKHTATLCDDTSDDVLPE